MYAMDSLLEEYNELMIKDIVNQKKKMIELEKKKDKDLLINKPNVSNESKFLWIVEIFGVIVSIITKSTLLIILGLLILPFLLVEIKINADLKKNREKIEIEYKKNLKEEMQEYEKIIKKYGFNTIEEYNQKVENIASKIIENFDEWTENHSKFTFCRLYLTINGNPIQQKEQLILCLKENVGMINKSAWQGKYIKNYIRRKLPKENNQ